MADHLDPLEESIELLDSQVQTMRDEQTYMKQREIAGRNSIAFLPSLIHFILSLSLSLP